MIKQGIEINIKRGVQGVSWIQYIGNHLLTKLTAIIIINMNALNFSTQLILELAHGDRVTLGRFFHNCLAICRFHSFIPFLELFDIPC